MSALTDRVWAMEVVCCEKSETRVPKRLEATMCAVGPIGRSAWRADTADGRRGGTLAVTMVGEEDEDSA